MAVEPFYRMKDVLFGYDTDLHFENDDLMITTGIDYIEREIYKLLITEPGDWKADLGIGAGLNNFTGEVNSRDTAERIQSAISDAIRITVAPAQAFVRAVPTNYSNIMVFIDLYSEDMQLLSIPFQFDFVNGFTKLDRADPRVIEQKPTNNRKENDISNIRRPNKYWSRISANSTTQT